MHGKRSAEIEEKNRQNMNKTRHYPGLQIFLFSVSWKKTSGNGRQLTDRAAPIGFDPRS